MAFCTFCGKEIENDRLLCDECMKKDNPEDTNPAASDGAEISESETVTVIPKETAKRSDLVLVALLAAPCLLIVNSLLFGGIGLGITIGAFLMALVTIWYSVSNHKTVPSLYALINILLLILSSIALTVSDENITKTLLLGSMVVLYLTFLVDYFGIRRKKAGTYRAFSDILSMSFSYGFGKIGDAAYALFHKTNDEGEIEKRKTGNIFAGIALALPVLFVVVPLLISSDAAFEAIFKNFSFAKIWEIIVTVGIGLLYLLIIFGRLFYVKSADKPEEQAPSNKGIEPVSICSFLGAISVAYIVYLFSQLAYFFSAFSGLLPEDFTMASYARRGFFEVCAVCAINLGIIFLTSVLCRKGEKGLPTAVKVLNIFLSAFSLILIGTAISKMLLYIDRFGMTRLRIYTSVFMIFLAFVFVSVIAKLFIRKVQYMKIILISACSILLVACLVDVDRVIASYNVNAFLSGDLESVDIETLSYLDDSATKPLIKLHKESTADVKLQAENELNRRLREHFEVCYNEEGQLTVKQKNFDMRSLNLSERDAVDSLYSYYQEFLFENITD